MPADLPGFYFDPDRNRYFPISRTGVKSGPPKNQASSQVTNELAKRTQKDSEIGPSSASPQGRKSNGLWNLLSTREVFKRHGLRQFGNTPQHFKQQCIEAYACSPRIWEYTGTSRRADGALEHVLLNLQTDDGEAQVNAILSGGSNGRLSAYASASFRPDQQNQGVSITPRQCLPSDHKLWSGEEKPLMLEHISNNTIFASKITAIKKLRQSLDASFPETCQRAIVTTLGSAESGGTLYLMRINSESRDSHMRYPISGVAIRLSASVITDCSVWTADCNAQGTSTCLGTSKGAGLVDLETGSLKWVCHSKSDLLSLQFESTGNIVMCGFRNGLISTIDLRAPPQWLHKKISSSASHDASMVVTDHPRFWNRRRQKRGTSNASILRGNMGTISMNEENLRKGEVTPSSTCQDLNEMQMKSALCSIVLLPSDNRYFLASAMDGTVCRWDRRMSKRGAVNYYEGLFNSHTIMELGVDPTETLVIAGGEDCTICIWSLASANLLHKGIGLSSPVNTVCWPTTYGLNTSQSNRSMELPLRDKYAWDVFLGTFDGLLHMHGCAS